MQINYIILAHKNPKQLKRLVDRLNFGEVKFYIHIDKAQNLFEFKRDFEDNRNVFFLEKRYSGIWGGLGTVKATVTAIKEILLTADKESYLVLVSGQDYPIQSNFKINEFLTTNYPKNFITSEILPSEKSERIKKYRINLSNKRYNYILLNTIWNKGFFSRENFKTIYYLIRNKDFKNLIKVLFPRISPKGINHHFGSQWWTISNQLAEKILLFLKNNPNYLQFHENTLIADEIFFQSIIANIVNVDKNIETYKSLTYVNWNRNDVELPVTFDHNDYSEIVEASKTKLFARKFEIKKSLEIMEKIDKNLL